MKQVRKNGYYWVKIKRTGLWVIGKWMSSYGWFSFVQLENDTRGGFSEIDERRIIRDVPQEINLEQFKKLHEQLKNDIEGVSEVVRKRLFVKTKIKRRRIR
jgi:hypothetical protein